MPENFRTRHASMQGYSVGREKKIRAKYLQENWEASQPSMSVHSLGVLVARSFDIGPFGRLLRLCDL